MHRFREFRSYLLAKLVKLPVVFVCFSREIEFVGWVPGFGCLISVQLAIMTGIHTVLVSIYECSECSDVNILFYITDSCVMIGWVKDILRVERY